ncbi:hypothetical protein SAMN06297358_0390 [Pedobacter xixiisoli]|uniref:Uncharacterized protein n=1 Tax=Pedobacter xixiisoli TaxID=1476464 RepID=A0A285ZQH4_9SPHI|nr:hypothetical protein SAMN06297358_0390 [Pedobacter xixiisoli]
MVSNKVNMLTHDQGFEDLQYWLTKSPIERLACVTYLVKQYHSKPLRMDKTKYGKIKF